MAEKTDSCRKPFAGKIPEDTRAHFRAAREEFHKGIEGFFPPEFREHHRKARKEMLMALSSMINASLERLEQEKLE